MEWNGMEWNGVAPVFRAECQAPWMDMNMIACCRYAIHPVRAATLAWRALASGIAILSLSYRPGAWQVSGGTRARTFRTLPPFHSFHMKRASRSIAVTETGGGGRVGSYILAELSGAAAAKAN